MKITKYEHACLVLEDNDQSIVIDPGNFCKNLPVPANLAGVFITHEHPDHWTPENVSRITNGNAQAPIYSTAATLALLSNQTHVMEPGKTAQAGNFSVQFIGGAHALISDLIPGIENCGVLVNNGAFYYPGDSFDLPTVSVQVLAVPANAPWMKMAEAINFILAVKPKVVFATHNGFLNEAGLALSDRLLGLAAAKIGAEYHPLQVGESVTI